ncbi:TPA: hypothetical protein WGW93_001058 [Neisseria meningitidis]|nr:hypothetical protein [Neisseria meningitidis]MBG9067199.1 hypothetical protein [Neisseria meningitidis]MBG9085228.1 hypothetical protein [Neisseria meningitidis]MBG9108093.1 hypothetical protein [Neisseria meningitidis]MBG9195500.1 hypothetical protein [Neisseria meningitidis]MBH5633081.1 hypothetical protein [Neisseria meningitidis]
MPSEKYGIRAVKLCGGKCAIIRAVLPLLRSCSANIRAAWTTYNRIPA